MTRDAEQMIAALSPEIDRKCAELRETRREKRRVRLFLWCCVLAVLIPTAFVLLGVSLLVLLIPAAFAAAGVVLLSPILIGQQGGRNCEQV